jgi:hypothetical protein
MSQPFPRLSAITENQLTKFLGQVRRLLIVFSMRNTFLGEDVRFPRDLHTIERFVRGDSRGETTTEVQE